MSRVHAPKADDQVCVICGEVDSPSSFSEPTRSIMIEKKICFGCEFWLEKVAIKDDPRVVRADGTHYWIGNEKSEGPSRWRGFGGDKFIIDFFDGRHVESTNLWHNGEIPEHFKAQLPDNAKLRRV